MTIKPTQPAPELNVATLDGQRFRLSERSPNAFTMIVFYRGLHCPICKPYLRELDHKLEEFESRGVDVIAVSTDTKERAARSKEERELGRLPIGYGLEIATARADGSCSFRAASRSLGPQNLQSLACSWCALTVTLYGVAVQSMPFVRLHFSAVLAAIDYIIKNNYPPRGEA